MVKKQESYENMVKRLEQIISDMEGSNINIEDALKRYEEGIMLSNKLYKILNDAEGKIKILSNGEEKNFIEDSTNGE